MAKVFQPSGKLFLWHGNTYWYVGGLFGGRGEEERGGGSDGVSARRK